MTTSSTGNALKNELDSDTSSSQDSESSFDEILKASELPPPGPLYYAARRALWLKKSPDNTPHTSPQPSTSRHKLEVLLNTPNAAFNDQVWEGGIHKVWKGLSAGASLKRRLPMNLVVGVIHCAWVRDETWPLGAVAPEPDDVLLEDDDPSSRTGDVL